MSDQTSSGNRWEPDDQPAADQPAADVPPTPAPDAPSSGTRAERTRQAWHRFPMRLKLAVAALLLFLAGGAGGFGAAPAASHGSPGAGDDRPHHDFGHRHGAPPADAPRREGDDT